jgi:LysM repeat protein
LILLVARSSPPYVSADRSHPDIARFTRNGCARITTANGLDPATTPAKQTLAASGPAGSVDDLARQVINGQWGNGDDRKRRLGARYAEVQARVNPLLAAGSKPAPPPARSYIVKSGDTLRRIADRHGTTWQTLAKINNLANPDLIHPGQTIRLP